MQKSIDNIYYKTTSRCIIIIGVFLQIKAHYVLWNIAVVFIIFCGCKKWLRTWETKIMDLKKDSV